MNFLESLELYVASQKLLAFQFMVIGGALLLCFLIITFMSSLQGPLWQGLKIGSIVCAVLISAFSVLYVNFSNNVQDDVSTRYQADQPAAVNFEVQRLEKIVREFPYYQSFFTALVLTGLGLLVFANPFWQGVGFAMVAMHATMMYFELHSKVAIMRHFELVRNL